MDSTKVLEEKVRVAEKDIDGLRDDMNSIDDEVRKISTTVTVMNERQEEMSRDIKMFNTNGGPPRCHERQIIIDSMAKSLGEIMSYQSLMKSEIATLQTTFALALQKQSTYHNIQKWGIEVVKAIVIGVVIGLLVAQMNSANAKELKEVNADQTVQVQ